MTKSISVIRCAGWGQFAAVIGSVLVPAAAGVIVWCARITANFGHHGGLCAGRHLTEKPVSFEPNRGQTHPRVKSLTHGPGYAWFLSPDEVVLSLSAVTAESAAQSEGRRDGRPAAIKPGGSKQIRVTFAPSAAQVDWGNLDIFDNLESSGETIYPARGKRRGGQVEPPRAGIGSQVPSGHGAR